MMQADSFPTELPAKDQDEINDPCENDLKQETDNRKTTPKWFCGDCSARDVNVFIKQFSPLNEKCSKCHAVLSHSSSQDLSEQEITSEKLTVLPMHIHNTVFRNSFLKAVEKKRKTIEKGIKKGRGILRTEFTVKCINPDTLKPNDLVSVDVRYVGLLCINYVTYDEYCETFGCDEHVKRLKGLFKKEEGHDPDATSKDEDSEKAQNMTYKEYCDLFGCDGSMKHMKGLFPKPKFSLKKWLSTRIFRRKNESKNVSQKKRDKLLDDNTQSKFYAPEKNGEDSPVVYYFPPDYPEFCMWVKVNEADDFHIVTDDIEYQDMCCGKLWK